MSRQIERITEFPEDKSFTKEKCVFIPLGEGAFLIQETNTSVKFWLNIDGQKTMIPDWYFYLILEKYKDKIFTGYKYSYLSKDYSEYYVYEILNKLYKVNPSQLILL